MLKFIPAKIASLTLSCDVTSLVGVKIWPSWGFVEKFSKSHSRRGLQKNHAQLQNQVASKQCDFLKSCFKFAQNRKKNIQNYPLGEASRMQVFEFQNHTQGEAFEFQPQIDQNYPLVGIQNHPLGEAFRKIMLNFKIKLHPGSQIFEKVASNSLKIENVVFKITL